MKTGLRITIAWIFSVAMASVVAEGANNITSPAIEKILDKTANLQLEDVTLEEAFRQLSEAMGVVLDEDQSAIGRLPYGGLTQLSSVQLQGMTWREALKELLKPLSLEFQTADDRVYILGTEYLVRQPRRCDLAELEALSVLQNTMLNDRQDKLLLQIRNAGGMDFGLIEDGLAKKEADDDIAEKILGKVPQPATAVLEAYAKMTVKTGRLDHGTWYVRSRANSQTVDIVMLAYTELVEIKLASRIDVEFRGRPVEAILGELSEHAGLELSYEPGCLKLLDEEMQNNCSLVVKGSTIKTALETLTGMTGLEYRYGSAHRGIYISAGEVLKNKPANGTQQLKLSNPTVCVLTTNLPGTDMETMIMIRQQDLESVGLLEKYEQVQKHSVAEFLQFLRDYKAPAAEN